MKETDCPLEEQEVKVEDKDYKIRRLETENLKLAEECKHLNHKLIEYSNYLKHIEMTVKLITNEIKLDIFVQD